MTTSTIQSLARKLLQKRGHTGAVAGSGRTAMNLLGQQVFDLVLVDVPIPEMDVFGATATLRAKEQRIGRRLKTGMDTSVLSCLTLDNKSAT